jgi:hypothetical protein
VIFCNLSQLYNENLKLTSDVQLIVFARSAKNSTPLILACRVVMRTTLGCAANDLTVSHETNSLPGNKMYEARLKKFSLQKYL